MGNVVSYTKDPITGLYNVIYKTNDDKEYSFNDGYKIKVGKTPYILGVQLSEEDNKFFFLDTKSLESDNNIYKTLYLLDQYEIKHILDDHVKTADDDIIYFNDITIPNDWCLPMDPCYGNFKCCKEATEKKGTIKTKTTTNQDSAAIQQLTTPILLSISSSLSFLSMSGFAFMAFMRFRRR